MTTRWFRHPQSDDILKITIRKNYMVIHSWYLRESFVIPHIKLRYLCHYMDADYLQKRHTEWFPGWWRQA